MRTLKTCLALLVLVALSSPVAAARAAGTEAIP
jgi:hypothetical protein